MSDTGDPLRVALLCDFIEEEWLGMDVVADALLQALELGHAGTIGVTRVRPSFLRIVTSVPTLRGRRTAFNVDRALNRYLRYPRLLRDQVDRHDIFHVMDHSYAHLVHALPRGRTVVTCHDLDALACHLEPTHPGCTLAKRWIASRVLSGLRTAAHVLCVSETVREELLEHRIVPPDRVSLAGNGVSPDFSPEPDARGDGEAMRLLGRESPSIPEVLHVGSTVPRKRIDVLLRVFGGIRERIPTARLVRVGGPFTSEQTGLAAKLGLEDAITVLPLVEQRTLAAVYRRATALLQTSEAEGFGLPVAEALACGTPVLGTDIPALRETGGTRAEYIDAANVPAWTDAFVRLWSERSHDPGAWRQRRMENAAHGAAFSWAAVAGAAVEVYRDVAARLKRRPTGGATGA